MPHLTMEQLLALRDDDRSEPGMAMAAAHFKQCTGCQLELDRLYQRTARIRALPTLAPATDEYPAVRALIHDHRRQRVLRVSSLIAVSLAASLFLGLVVRDLARPTHLDAEQQIQTAMSRSQQLEQTLQAWGPDQHVMDGRTALAVAQLERRIADLDAQLAEASQARSTGSVQTELQLWQQRVGLMNALVTVHLTKASNVGL